MSFREIALRDFAEEQLHRVDILVRSKTYSINGLIAVPNIST